MTSDFVHVSTFADVDAGIQSREANNLYSSDKEPDFLGIPQREPISRRETSTMQLRTCKSIGLEFLGSGSQMSQITRTTRRRSSSRRSQKIVQRVAIAVTNPNANNVSVRSLLTPTSIRHTGKPT